MYVLCLFLGCGLDTRRLRKLRLSLVQLLVLGKTMCLLVGLDNVLSSDK